VTCVYVGGTTVWPNYQAMGDHTEGVVVYYDPEVLSYKELLDFFFKQHNPWSNCSSRRQYMSGAWWHNDKQRDALKEKVAALETNKKGQQTVKTFLGPVTKLYRAEEYHQKYYSKNGEGGLDAFASAQL